MMLLDNLHFTKPLITFICSVNFMFFSYCATLGKIETSSQDMRCEKDTDCVPNAYCLDGMYCRCNKDFVPEPISHMCLEIAKGINDACKIDIQCTSSFGYFSICYKNGSNEVGQCKCGKNSHFHNSFCYPSARLGEVCEVSDNCISASEVATYCVYNANLAIRVCVCAANHHPTDDRLDCLPDIGLGMRCHRDEECAADHSYCSGVCRCQTGYIASADNKTCLHAAKELRGRCSEDSQCQHFLPNTFCDSRENNCKCAPFTHELDRSCWITARLGEKCSHPNECVTISRNMTAVQRHVGCRQGVCSCVDGYSRNNLDCVKDLKANSSALEKCTFLLVAVVLLSLPND